SPNQQIGDSPGRHWVRSFVKGGPWRTVRVSAADLLILVPAGTAAGAMVVVVTLNGLATIERRLSEAPVPGPSAAPLLRPERTGLPKSLSVAEDAASRPNAPPTLSPRGS